MDLDGVRALSFDCYGTMIDWETGLARVLVPWAARHGADGDAGALLAAFGRHESRVQREQPDLLYPLVLAAAFRGVGTDLGLPVSEEEAARLGSSVPDWPAFDDSREALARLAGQFALVVLSNVDRASFRASAERLGDPFTRVLTAEDIGSYKPDRRNFDALLSAVHGDLGVAPGGLVHVAQSLFHDVAPANALGLRTVWIDRRGGHGGGATPDASAQPTWTFPTLGAFADAALA